MDLSSPSSSFPAIPSLRANWSFRTDSPPAGLGLAREKGAVLAWDVEHRLYLLDTHDGECEVRAQAPTPVAAACSSDDGSSYACASPEGAFWWLAPSLVPRWEGRLDHAACALALDPFGKYLALADVEGQVYLCDCTGRRLWKTRVPRGLRHLAFVPELPLLVGGADMGLIVGISMGGEVLWKDGLPAHIGSLSSSGDGSLVVLACFSDGLRCYDRKGGKYPTLQTEEPCLQAALSFDAGHILTVGPSLRLQLLDSQGQLQCAYPLDRSTVSLALGALADRAVVALNKGPILGLDLVLDRTRQ